VIKSIHVVAGVIFNSENKILIAKRPSHKHQGGLWEFPGGKVMPGESQLNALTRELLEELDIAIDQAEKFMQIQHDYADLSVTIDVWKVTSFSGEAQGKEGQEIKWVSNSELAQYEFPAANSAIIQKLK
jgi:8-oxo-dGTP diphosphatase